MHEFDNCPAKPRLEYLEKKDAEQNESLQRIEAKIDRVLWAIVGGLGVVVMALIGAVITAVVE
jgi:hypothetical protein